VYDPIRYVMSGGGKRLRAVLTILACEALGGRARSALNAAVAIELLHNFTLVHDDVMDHARLRRNKKTVHERWDTNTAILAGDEMIALAYAVLQRPAGRTPPQVLAVFTRAFVEVCEGQGFDKEFESRGNVSVREYSAMIRQKTARVISAAAEIGALAANAGPRERKALRSYGEHIGMAFQMNDDLLDIIGDQRAFGKAIGGDIAEGKKTLLLLRAIERAGARDRQFLRSLRPGARIPRKMVDRVRRLYITTGAVDEVRRNIASMTRAAQRALSGIPAGRGKAMLSWLADELVERSA
jgi:geranylgeranyl diphosphate synthase type II